MKETDEAQYLGGMMGVAVGDALGLPFETKTASEIRNMIMENPKLSPLGGRLEMIDFINWFHLRQTGKTVMLPAGLYSDDTAMSLALAASIIEKLGFDLEDQFLKYREWLFENRFVPAGTQTFGVGGTTKKALKETYTRGDKLPGYKYADSVGTAPLMRSLPLGLAFHGRPYSDLKRYSMEAAKLTHGHDVPAWCSLAYNLMISLILQDASKDGVQSAVLNICGHEMHTEVRGLLEVDYENHKILTGDFVSDETAQLIKTCAVDYKTGKSDGKLSDPLEQAKKEDHNRKFTSQFCFMAALSCLMTTDNFREAIESVIKLGGDTDTQGAILGGLAGTYYGIDGIPESWKRDVKNADLILHTAACLHAFNRRYGKFGIV